MANDVEQSLVAAHPDLGPLLEGQAASQRARLLEGMMAAVSEKGYAAATVADAVAHARVSRGTFYALFSSKEECFLESYRHGVDVLQARVGEASDRAGGWREGLEAGLRVYLQTLAAEPRFARAYLLEIHAAGPAAEAARDEVLRAFARRYGASFAAATRRRPTLAVPPADILFMLAAGVDQLVCAQLRAHGAERLPELLGTLTTAALSVLDGYAQAIKKER
jgi:AcrR family transcriptional regulator